MNLTTYDSLIAKKSSLNIVSPWFKGVMVSNAFEGGYEWTYTVKEGKLLNRCRTEAKMYVSVSLSPSISQAYSEREKIYMYCGKKVASNLHTKVTIINYLLMNSLLFSNTLKFILAFRIPWLWRGCLCYNNIFQFVFRAGKPWSFNIHWCWAAKNIQKRMTTNTNSTSQE